MGLDDLLNELKNEVRKANRRIRNHNKKHGGNIPLIHIDYSSVNESQIQSSISYAKSKTFSKQKDKSDKPKITKPRKKSNPNTTLTTKERNSLKSQGATQEQIETIKLGKKSYFNKTGKRLRLPTENSNLGKFTDFVERFTNQSMLQEEETFKSNYIKSLYSSLGADAEQIVELLERLPTSYIHDKHYEYGVNKWLLIEVTYEEHAGQISMRAQNIFRAMYEDAKANYPDIISQIKEEDSELKEMVDFIENTSSDERYETGVTEQSGRSRETIKSVRNRYTSDESVTRRFLAERGYTKSEIDSMFNRGNGKK